MAAAPATLPNTKTKVELPTRSRDPERTRRAILDAATKEFAEHGLSGARVDAIAARAGANKRMLYHYFGNKEDLYLAALEQVYADIRNRERRLRLEDLPVEAAMRELVLITWRHFIEHPEFLSLLATENLLRARHLKRSKLVRQLHSPLVQMIANILERGAASGEMRADVDPVQLYISIASLGWFYLSNRFTLGTIFDRDLDTESTLAERGQHMVDVILGYLRPTTGRAATSDTLGVDRADGVSISNQ
jgi:AcrR family transcriptional regulator